MASRRREASASRAGTFRLRAALRPTMEPLDARFALANVAAPGASMDRVRVDARDGALVALLADGAGGTGGAADAADDAMAARDTLDPAAALRTHGAAAARWIERLDRLLAASAHGGQCTAVALVLGDDGLAGASAGDSGAWLCTPSHAIELTLAQRRKPLLGSGRAVAVPFAHAAREGRVLVASDGLFRYAPSARIAAAACDGSLTDAVARLVALVRLPSGALQDDVSIALIAARSETR